MDRAVRISAHLALHTTSNKIVGTDATKYLSSVGTDPISDPSAPKTEAQLRVELAAAYRILAHHGWDDGVQNHLTVRVPGEREHFLINSYGMGFEEVTALSLVKIDIEGNVIDPGSVAPAVNHAGFNIHGAIHRAREDALCVMHSHESNTAAVASMNEGFMPLSQHAMICGPVPIHPYSLTVGEQGPAECKAMAACMGKEHRIMLLENHGVITTGESVAEALMRLWYVIFACNIQVKAMASDTLNTLKPEVQELLPNGASAFFFGNCELEFAHQRRIIDRVNPGYNDLE